MSDSVIDVLRGVAQTRDDDNRMHDDDFSTPPTDGAAFWRAADDLTRLAELRAHGDFAILQMELEGHKDVIGPNVVALLLKLLRGES